MSKFNGYFIYQPGLDCFYKRSFLKDRRLSFSFVANPESARVFSSEEQAIHLSRSLPFPVSIVPFRDRGDRIIVVFDVT